MKNETSKFKRPNGGKPSNGPKPLRAISGLTSAGKGGSELKRGRKMLKKE
jgi:hypothetical protein